MGESIDSIGNKIELGVIWDEFLALVFLFVPPVEIPPRSFPPMLTQERIVISEVW